MPAKKALITGATGFVGKHLVRRLVEDGWQVCIVLRKSSFIETLGDTAVRVEVFEHDGSTGSMAGIVKESAPDVVFHLASLFLAQHTLDDIEGLVRSNVLFGTQLLEGMSAAGVTRLVNTGTSWQHYENSDYNPVCLYAATKQAFEAMVGYYVETCSMKAVTLKLYDTYGPEDTRKKLFALLRQAWVEGTRLDMSAGDQMIDLVYIDDVVEAFMLSARLLLDDKVVRSAEYAVSSGSPIRLKDLVETYSRVTGHKLDINWGARPYRPREVMEPWSRGRPVPGWEPGVKLEIGLRRLEDNSGAPG